jgi:eukaryotic-like serine/threonine-protein kinase
VDTPELTGRRLGDRYALEQPIASGGMATVWRATDEVLGRSVAVKILHDNLVQDGALLDRFRMEAVAAARLSHPAVVRVFDTGIDDGVCYIVMELFEGATLANLLDTGGALPPDEAARVVVATLQGLAHAHQEGVIHRDVKPSNILVGSGGTVKVTDFGIAKAAFAEGDVTTTGNLLGTAKYLAPEQVHGGGEIDARADLYSAGIVLYEALTGRTPFEAETHLATATMRLTRDPTPPGSLRPGIPRGVEAVVLKALTRDPEDRFQTAEEMSAALDRAVPAAVRSPTGPRRGQRPAPSRAPAGTSAFRSWGLVPLILLLVAALAVGGFFLFGEVLPAGIGGGNNGDAAGSIRPFEVSGTPTVYDPPPGDGSEQDSTLPGAVDGDGSTAWETEHYDQVDLGGRKPGVGIVLSLGQAEEVAAVRIRTLNPGWSFEVKGSQDGSTFTEALPSLDDETTFTMDGTSERVQLEPVSYRYFLIWIVELAPSDVDPGRWRATVAEADLFPLE